jgi:hypothetical protein
LHLGDDATLIVAPALDETKSDAVVDASIIGGGDLLINDDAVINGSVEIFGNVEVNRSFESPAA